MPLNTLIIRLERMKDLSISVGCIEDQRSHQIYILSVVFLISRTEMNMTMDSLTISSLYETWGGRNGF